MLLATSEENDQEHADIEANLEHYRKAWKAEREAAHVAAEGSPDVIGDEVQCGVVKYYRSDWVEIKACTHYEHHVETLVSRKQSEEKHKHNHIDDVLVKVKAEKFH